MTKKTKSDVYQIVTDRIITALEKGTIPWRKTWTAEESMPKNLVSKKAYRGANIWMLFCSPFSSPYWLTFNQCKKLGGSVRKGEKGTPVVFWNFFEKRTGRIDDSGVEIVDNIPFLRYYTVFNTDQCDGLEFHLPKIDPTMVREFNSIEECERVVAAYPEPKVEIKYGGGRAAYNHDDFIKMPNPETFESDEDYYSTLFHELVHSTGAPNRLKRKSLISSKCDDYSNEELVAELGSSYLCALTRIDNHKLDENAEAYIAGWLLKLREDKKLIVIAAAQAQKAVDYMTKALETKEVENIQAVA